MERDWMWWREEEVDRFQRKSCRCVVSRGKSEEM
jgi:hypothetical protein